MTALTAPTPGDPAADVPDPEALARRSLGLDAAFCLAVGAAAAVAAGPIAGAVGVSSGLVRVAGVVTVGWAGVVGLWSVAEEWQPPTRRVLGVNALAAAALLGHAAARGTPRGRVGVAGLAAAVAGFGAVQLKALIAAEPRH